MASCCNAFSKGMMLSAGFLAFMASSSAETPSPYVELRAREIKALSPQEIEDLRSGSGMGLALPAELNGFPGPRHVLELADEIELDADQRARIQAVGPEQLFETRRKGRQMPRDVVGPGGFQSGARVGQQAHPLDLRGEKLDEPSAVAVVKSRKIAGCN